LGINKPGCIGNTIHAICPDLKERVKGEGIRERERETGRRGAATHSRGAGSVFRSSYQQFV
jgi:hypothetical protein